MGNNDLWSRPYLTVCISWIANFSLSLCSFSHNEVYILLAKALLVVKCRSWGCEHMIWWQTNHRSGTVIQLIPTRREDIRHSWPLYGICRDSVLPNKRLFIVGFRGQLTVLVISLSPQVSKSNNHKAKVASCLQHVHGHLKTYCCWELLNLSNANELLYFLCLHHLVDRHSESTR